MRDSNREKFIITQNYIARDLSRESERKLLTRFNSGFKIGSSLIYHLKHINMIMNHLGLDSKLLAS